jgi:hypothetical protein
MFIEEFVTLPTSPPPAYSINPRAVDWERAMRTVNAWVDTEVAMIRVENFAQRHALAVPLEKQRDAWLTEFAREPSLHPQPGESREDYTDRLTHSLIAAVEPAYEFVPIEYHELMMRTAMARTLVDAAVFKATAGHWPAQLPPAGNDASGTIVLPVDVYSPGGNGAVKYILTASGPRLYSVGRNGIDDQGERNASGKDDISLGSPSPVGAAAPVLLR